MAIVNTDSTSDLAKGNAQPGDKLILTKPLGTGIINTAIKAKMTLAAFKYFTAASWFNFEMGVF